MTEKPTLDLKGTSLEALFNAAPPGPGRQEMINQSMRETAELIEQSALAAGMDLAELLARMDADMRPQADEAMTDALVAGAPRRGLLRREP